MKHLAAMIFLTAAAHLVGSAAAQAAPHVKNNPAAENMLPGETRLEGILVGGGPADVSIYWGPADGGTTAGNWAHSSPPQNVKDGTPLSATADHLIYGQTYYYRSRASNKSGSAWASATAHFTTLRPTVAIPGANGRPVLPDSSGLVCWYDAAVGVVKDAKGVVQIWKDRSGNGHYATLAAGAPLLASNQIHGRPAIQFRAASGLCGFNVDGPLVVEEQYVVVRSPSDKWSSDGCFFGRRWARNSSYRLSGKSTAFWGDQFPIAVSRNGKKIQNRPFDLAPITDYMILKIDVNDADLSKNTYQIGMADLASCDFDVAEILAYQTPLSPSDEELVGGYLAAKYGISTAYPARAGLDSAASLTNLPATVQGPTSAVLSASLACPESVYDVRVYWGTTDGGTDASLWEHSAPVGTWTNAATTRLAPTVSGLTPGATYYFTFRATNPLDSFWADRVRAFRAGGAAARSAPPTLRVTSGLACWYDASIGVATGAKGVVQNWKDLSGNGHDAAPGGGSPALVPNQINSQPAVQFRNSWLALAGTFFAKEHYIVVRSPSPQWSGPAGLLGRRKGRGSSYNTWGKETGFWHDRPPAAVTRNGAVLPGPAFDCSPLTKFMVLKIIVDDASPNAAAYAIGNNDGLAGCDFDIAEILGYRSILSPTDGALVGGYLAAKYKIDTAYPPLPPRGAKAIVSAAASAGAGESAAVKYRDWQHSGSFFLLTTPDGADLRATAVEENFPLLVRLDKDWFNFSEAQSKGQDIRFATSEGLPLAFQIDHWDAASGAAAVWVRVPTVKGDARQAIRMFWGNAAAKDASSGPAVFNNSNGYLSVWHMDDPATDDAGTVQSTDKGTDAAAGIIGPARHFFGEGIDCGERITAYPFVSSPHSTEAWFKADRFNTTILDWGKYDQVALRLPSTPAHVEVVGRERSVHGTSVLQKSQWYQVVYTYDGQNGMIYLNGRPDIAAPAPSTMQILTPVRMDIGGRFFGDLDEVRISKWARSANWIKLQYENQKPLQTAVGPLVQPGNDFSVSRKNIVLLEGGRTTVLARAGGAQKLYWIVKTPGSETVVATDTFHYTLDAGRVTGDRSFSLELKAIFADGAKTLDIPVTVKREIPDPVFTLSAPAKWDGRGTIELSPHISNLAAMRAKGAGELKYEWTVPPLVEVHEIEPGRLILRRARNSGKLIVSLAVSNGGVPVSHSVEISVREPLKDAWVRRVPGKDEKPVDNQFYARDDANEGKLYYNGALPTAATALPQSGRGAEADSVFLKLYADGKLIHTESQKLPAGRSYAFAAKLKPGLIRYKVEFGSKSGNIETVLHTADNLVCGDAYVIEGQSNAEATAPGGETTTNPWIRTYNGGWGDAVRAGTQRWIGYWGMDLALRLVADEKIPICIINGAVGGTRVDQHMPNPADHYDFTDRTYAIYGNLLTRVAAAKLTHGIRGVLWHQGEADQGTDGPDGGYGWETYQRYFLAMTAAWKSDMPNIQHYYLFQIWPNACSQGGTTNSDKLRDLQRRLPRLYSNMSVMSTLGIKPEGSCHYPPAGYAEMARLMTPLVERDNYGKIFDKPITAPDLKAAFYTSAKKDEIALRFDQPMAWHDSLTSEFQLDGKPAEIAAGTASGNTITLKLPAGAAAKTITYLVDRKWNPNNLLYGQNGIAALTFCEVPIEPMRPSR